MQGRATEIWLPLITENLGVSEVARYGLSEPAMIQMEHPVAESSKWYLRAHLSFRRAGKFSNRASFTRGDLPNLEKGPAGMIPTTFSNQVFFSWGIPICPIFLEDPFIDRPSPARTASRAAGVPPDQNAPPRRRRKKAVFRDVDLRVLQREGGVGTERYRLAHRTRVQSMFPWTPEHL